MRANPPRLDAVAVDLVVDAGREVTNAAREQRVLEVRQVDALGAVLAHERGRIGAVEADEQVVLTRRQLTPAPVDDGNEPTVVVDEHVVGLHVVVAHDVRNIDRVRPLERVLESVDVRLDLTAVLGEPRMVDELDQLRPVPEVRLDAG